MFINPNDLSKETVDMIVDKWELNSAEDAFFLMGDGILNVYESKDECIEDGWDLTTENPMLFFGGLPNGKFVLFSY